MDIFSKREIVSAIVHEGGFSRAAKVLHVAQPSLSVMVAGIEGEIGALLFDRSTNPVRLTDIGQKYIECCESIGIIEDDFRNYVNESKGLHIGTLSLGGNNLYMSSLVPEILSVYSYRHPSIHIRLYDHESRDLIRMLDSGEIDMAIDNLPDSSRHDKHYLGTEFLFIAVPASDTLNKNLRGHAYTYEDITNGAHLHGERPYIVNMRPFNDRPFILLQEGFDTRRRCENLFSDHGIRPKTLYELNQLSTAFGMAASGLGITIVSDTLIRSTPDLGSRMLYYSVDHPEFRRDVNFYTLKSRMLTLAIKEFIEISRELRPLSIFQTTEN